MWKPAIKPKTYRLCVANLVPKISTLIHSWASRILYLALRRRNEGTAYSVIIIITILLNCILNGIATCNFYFSVSDFFALGLLKTISCQMWLSYMPTFLDTTTMSPRTGHQISRIQSSYKLLCALIWNLSHFIWFKVRFLGHCRTFFKTDKDYFPITLWGCCTSCKTSYNV